MTVEVLRGRVRDEWAATMLRATREAAQAATAEHGLADLFAMARELTTSIATDWGATLNRLEQHGIPANILAASATHAGNAAESMREALLLFRDHFRGQGATLREVDDLLATLDRIRRQAGSALTSSKAPPPTIDAERLRAGLEQAERGEGEDAADILARIRSGAAP